MAKKVSKKVVAETTDLAPKVKKKKVTGETSIFDVASIMDEMKGYDLEVMGADTQERIPYIIPFSNHSLQKITGGIIGGRFVEISGDSQCLAEGTLVATPTGPKEIEKLKVGEEVFGFNKDGSVTPTKVINVFNNGPREVYEIWNKHKRMAEATLDHKWGTLTTTGAGNEYFGEDELRDVRNNKRKFIHRRFVDYQFEGSRINHAYAIGALLGDGCSKQGVSGIHISSKDDKIPNKVKDILGAKDCYRQSEKCFTYVIANGKGKGFNHEPVRCDFYEDYIKGRYAHEKNLPESILVEWDRWSLLNLIAGLIDTDGSVYLNSGRYLNITFTTTSLLLGDLYSKLIHRVFQVKPRFHLDEREDGRQCFQYILGDNHSCKRVLKTLDEYLVSDWKKFQPEYENLEEHISDRIGVTTGDSRWANTYDIEVDNETHLYLLHDNGLVTHNSGKSFLLYDLIKNCIAMGGTVLLCDTEIAYDPAYGRRIGLNTGANFIYTKNNNIRVLFESAKKFVFAVRKVKKKIPILIAVDSFAGLKHPDAIKNAENNEDKGYEAMQKNAYFSQKLDGFVNILDKYDVTFVLINQTREDHQVQYGDNTYTLGENVIKFWCTQRLRGKLGEKDKVKVNSLKPKEKKKQVGVTAIWETIKNRRIEPFQRVEVKVNYSKGMLKYSGLAELLANDGVIVNATKTVILKDADGNEILDSKKKPKKVTKRVLKIKATGETFENVKELVKAHPEFLEPKLIDSVDVDLDSDEFQEDETEEYTLNA